MEGRSPLGGMNRGKSYFLPAAIFKPPTALRGGIPIWFLQFGNCIALEQHGFASNKMWAVDDDPPPIPSFDPIGKSFIDLVLKPSEDDLKAWPHSNGDLTLISRVRNVNGKLFGFSFAYLTYLSVSDISEVRIEGLETLDYLDNLCQRERFTEQRDVITFESESAIHYLFWLVDRIYLSASNVTAVLDHKKMRTYLPKKQGLLDTVVGNPWGKKAKAMANFGDEEYKQMLCVNGAAMPHHLEARLGVDGPIGALRGAVELSFCSEHLDLQDGVGT